MAKNDKKHNGPGFPPAVPDESLNVPVLREEIATVFDPQGQIAEQFRALRNSIQSMNADGASHTLVVTSAVPGEGKTVTALNLAVSLSELPGVHTLVLDADMHEPSVEKYLGLPRRQGLAEVLAGQLTIDQAVRATSIEGVSIMGAGTRPQNPSELLGSDRMKAVINHLRQNHSYVVIDTPAALNVSDASLLGSMADGILLVVKLGSTARYHVQRTHNTLEALGGNVLGTFLVDANMPNIGKDYSRG
ncbi:MAG: CpsD/CapB family tyrosine-protein kinase [bacterium]|nr:CpsD/CapB family tyrosine-protein kinase [bacterium]